ncbi:MAG TPA: translation initiation factor IF-2 [Clostridiales bacterium]|nr:translation initiation factor IF-2 [Clostridiales bacterium]
MEEKKVDISRNIKKIKSLTAELDALKDKIKELKSQSSAISKKITAKERVFKEQEEARLAAEEAERRAAEEAAEAAIRAEIEAEVQAQLAAEEKRRLEEAERESASEEKKQEETERNAQAEEAENVAEEKKPIEKKSEKKSEEKSEDKSEKPVEKTVVKTTEEDRKKAEEAARERAFQAAREKILKKKREEAIARGEDPDKIQLAPKTTRVYEPKPTGRRAGGNEMVYVPKDRARKPADGKPAFGPRTQRNGQTSAKPVEVTYIPPKDTGKTGGKKRNSDKNYDDRKAINKKSLIKTQVSIEDFDENKTGYRKLRTKKDKKQDDTAQSVKIEKAVINKEIIPLKELSEKLGISAIEITKKLFKEGIMKTINDSVDYDTAGVIAADLGIELELKMDKTAEEVLSETFDFKDDETKLIKRAPVVTVMGHVDHGKTSLLDKIRSANVTASEAGGITQHIGAYTVSINGEKITFLDTPGHAAFTAMRQRGAQITDIAVIVIAADDGIMPQTIEAIHHAQAAGVSIIVAANKIDKPQANIERVKQQLADQSVLVEEWGGDVALVPVSAKTGEGIDSLLETILLTADVKELKANPDRPAKGTIIEAKLDKGKGPMATVLIENGTLRIGDNLVAGTITGRVRAMIDDKGRNVKEAGPSAAVSILGLEEVPNAGDNIYAVEQDKLSKLVAEERKNKEREEMIKQSQKVTLDDLFSKISDGNLKVFNILIKADVQGSVEAVRQSLTELSNDEVKVNVVHSAVGAINETDVMLADSSNAVIIGFNVRPDANAKILAEKSKVDVKLYRIIYEAIDDVENAMKGLIAPKTQEIYMGKAEVRQTFKITGVGMVAGSYVTEGKIVRNGKLRIYREDVMICEGNVNQLKRFKDDVKEVSQGFECGISIENFNDIKIGDFIECYIIETKPAV